VLLGDNAGMLASSELKSQKRVLREQVLACRTSLSAVERNSASMRIMESLIAHAAFANTQVVLAYASFSDEVETATYLRHVLESNKTLVLPRVDKVGQRLVLHHITSLDHLVTGTWGIREPRVDAPIVTLADIDLALVPGVAFDRRGGRLGYGGGYYDKLFSPEALSEAKALVRLSAAFACQIIERVPLDDHDICIPTIITENEIISTHDC
jgi:5-formyltetrahydrofolate cyclo-ligase